MKLRILAAFFICVGSASSYAQEPKIDLVDYFTAYEHSFRCDFSRSVLEEVKNIDESQIESNIRSEIEELQEALEGDLSRSEKKMLRHQERVLKRLLKTSYRKPEIQKFYEGFCSGTEFVVSNSAKAVAHASNVINQSLSLPVRFVYRFFKGLSTGTVSTDPQLTFFEAVGKNKARSVAFYGLYQGYKALMASNPYTIPFLITPMADYLAMSVCETKTKLRADEFRFCSNYEAVKLRFFGAAKDVEKFGASISKHKSDSNTPKKELPREVTDENLCDYLQIVHNDKTNNEKFIEFKKVMLLMNTPGYFSYPKTHEYKTEESMILRGSSAHTASLRNVIISLAPRESIQDEMKASGEYKNYEKKMKQLRRQQKIFGSLYRSGSLAACQAKKSKHEFNLKDYDQLKDEVSNHKNASYLFQHKLVKNQIKKAEGRFQFFNKTKLDWEVIQADTLNDVHQILRNNHVGNVILLAHSEGTYGKLVDSSLAQYPTSFFSDLSPSLMSISFYSCHADKIIKTFNLEHKLTNSPTFHSERKLYFAQDANMIDGDGAPLSGFGDFLIRVDHDLVSLIQGNMLDQSLKSSEYPPALEQKICKLDVGRIQVDQGTLSVVLNRRFMGTINRYDRKTIFEFPCSWAMKGENTVVLQNSSLIENLKLSQSDISLSIQGMDIEVLSAREFKDPNTGIYSSSKIIFMRK